MNVKVADSKLSDFKKCWSEGFLSHLESGSICIVLLQCCDQMLLFPKGLWLHLFNKCSLTEWVDTKGFKFHLSDKTIQNQKSIPD